MKNPKSLGRVWAFITHSVSLNTDDKVWKAWLNLKEDREWRDLVALIGSNVREEFKMRAIAILLIPQHKFLPFEWREESWLTNSFGTYDRSTIKIAQFSEKLRDFTADLILYCIALIKDCDGAMEEGGMHRAIRGYNYYILEFLKILPENDARAERLFLAYSLNDPVAYFSMDESSGYNPLYPMLNTRIPESWKKRASYQMHDIIRNEIAGRSKPREEFEEALVCYLNIIQSPLAGSKKKIRYSKELFVEQLEFVLSLPAMRDRELIRNWVVGPILRILKGNQHKDLRHRLARHVVLENKTFKAYDLDTKRAAMAMLNEFGSDKELAAKLKTILADAKKDAEEEARTKSTEEDKAQKVLSQMA